MKDHDIPADAIEKGKLRILIIDSRVEHSKKLANILYEKGSFDIQCAHNGFDAGLSALRFQPNIIMIDLLSNEIESGSLCRYVRQCEELADCSLIALAGGLSPREVQNLQNQGFDYVVTESANLNAIFSCIQKTCDIVH